MIYHFTVLNTQDPVFGLIMSFGGVGAQWGALFPILGTSTTVVVAPTYDKIQMARAFQDER